MNDVLAVYPGAQRALFRKYHIGGCSSCGFQPTETLEQVCARNGDLDVNEVLEHIKTSHEQDAKILISPKELAELLEKDKSVKLLDVRSREEFEAMHIEGAMLMSQPTVQEIMGRWPRNAGVRHRGSRRESRRWTRRRISWGTVLKTCAACAAALTPGRRKWIRAFHDINSHDTHDRIANMNDDLQKRIREAMLNPQNMGEMAGADSVGTVGNSDCGEMLRMWVKFKDENGKKVIDRATFQSFGCETAIAVASLATELIRGKTAEEALALKTEELAGELGPLPPMKIHCAQLVEGALRSALDPERRRSEADGAGAARREFKSAG